MHEAADAYRRVLALRSDLPAVWNNLGNALRHTDRPSEAIEAFRRAIALRADYALAWNNLAGSLKDAGQLDEALACYDRGIELEPDRAAVGSSRLGILHYLPSYDAKAILEQARQWDLRYARLFNGEITAHDNDPSPQRRLRIGYLSPDFRRHCAAVFLAPLFAHHDHARFEIFAYSSVEDPDAVTTRMQGQADAWRDISGLTDQVAAQQIRQDKIDVLVDLALHTASNRLLIFARKPAPIQVTWLGYPGTTGLETMDYRLTDPRLDPPGSGTRQMRVARPAACRYHAARLQCPQAFTPSARCISPTASGATTLMAWRMHEMAICPNPARCRPCRRVISPSDASIISARWPTRPWSYGAGCWRPCPPRVKLLMVAPLGPARRTSCRYEKPRPELIATTGGVRLSLSTPGGAYLETLSPHRTYASIHAFHLKGLTAWMPSGWACRC